MRLTSPPATPSRPITAAEFAAAMAGLGAYEPRPHLAIAVSGGADSMALAHLTQRWARARKGTVVALTVDHAMRAESAAEATRVAGWLRQRHIDCHILTHSGSPPTADMQAVARDARYRLLLDWCGRHGVIHLVLGHHMDDQAETLLLRLGRGSGVNGLAAMAPVVERPAARLLRPALGFPRARLRATARRADLPWVEDPSNRDPRHARARLRAALPALGGDLAAADRLAATARHLGRARAALDSARNQLLGCAVTVHPAGFLWLDPGPFRAAPDEIALRALTRCLATVGGTVYGPRLDRLERLHAAVIGDRSARPVTRTIAGCRVSRQATGAVLISREAAAVAPPVSAPRQAGCITWDHRFFVDSAVPLAGVQIGALGNGHRQLADHPGLKALPGPVRGVLPAIWRRNSVLAVPHAGFWPTRDRRSGIARVKITFCPVSRLSEAPFTIV